MEKLLDVFYYDETSPSFLRWKVKTGKVNKGDVAGCLAHGCDYYRVRYNKKLYRCHRVIWYLFNKSIDDDLQVDHINGVSTDNHISNLRLVTNQQNGQNVKKHSTNTSGVVGVCLDSIRNRWISQWYDLSGNGRRKVFNINKYGYDLAFQLACEYRCRMIKELNSEGCDYTDRHGI